MVLVARLVPLLSGSPGLSYMAFAKLGARVLLVSRFLNTIDVVLR